MNSTVKTLIFWTVIAVSAVMLWQVVRTGGTASHPREISYSQFLSDVADGKVAQVRIEGTRVWGDYKNGGAFSVTIPPNATATVQALAQHGVEIWFRDASQERWPNWILNLAPLVLLAALWLFMIRQIQRAQRNRGSWPQQPPSGSDLPPPPPPSLDPQ